MQRWKAGARCGVLRMEILTFDQDAAAAVSGKSLRGRGLYSLSFAFEELAVGDALHELHLDFGLFVGDARGVFRDDDQRLRAVGLIEGALKL